MVKDTKIRLNITYSSKWAKSAKGLIKDLIIVDLQGFENANRYFSLKELPIQSCKTDWYVTKSCN